MSQPSQLVRRIEDLEIIEKDPEPGAIVCEPDEVDILRAKYPHAVLLVDDISQRLRQNDHAPAEAKN